MRRILAIVAALFCALTVPAFAVSTVNPAVPAQNSTLTSAVVRNNFLATYNDINNILGKFAGSVAPANQTSMQDWVDTSSSPNYKFKFWNPSTSSWIQWGTLNINTGVFSVVATSGSFAATAPVTLGFSGGVATYGLSYDSNFTVSAGALALNPIASARLLANCTGGSAEPTGCAWTSFADQAIGSSNGMLPYRTGGSWGSVSTGTSGHTVPLLDATALTFSGVLMSYAGASTPAAAQSGALFRGVALDGAVARAQLDSFGNTGFFSCVRADGTLAVPSALLTNDQICGFNAHGYNSSAYATSPSASVRIFAAQNWTPTANGSYVRIATTPNGSTTLTDVVSFENDGGVTIPPTVSGGDKGVGTLNATGLYVGGTAVITGNQTITLSGDVSGSGATAITTTLATVNSNVGTFGAATTVPQITVNAKGLVTAVSTASIPNASSSVFGLAKCDNITISCAGGVFATIASSSGGCWTNTRLAKTSAYAVLSGDSGSTFALGGSAFFPLTFNAASGYGATTCFMVINEDTSFGKLLVPQIATSSTSITIGTGSKAFTTSSGLPILVPEFGSTQRYRVFSLANPSNFMSGVVASYVTTTLTITVDTIGGSGTFTDWQIAPEVRLWPGQSQMVFRNNNSWAFAYQGQRWKQPGQTEVCVDASGSNSNDGLGVGTRCFKNIQYATNVVYQEWDANNIAPNIGLYTGPFNENVQMQGQITGYNFINYNTRAANTWTNTAVSTGAGAACAVVSDNAEARFVATFGFTQTWTCNTNNVLNTGAFYEHQIAVVDVVGAHNFRSGGTNDNVFFADGEGRATISGTGAGIILGNGGTSTFLSFVWCDYHCSGVTTGGTWSYSGNVSISAFLVARGGSVIDYSANPTNGPGTGTVNVSLSFCGSVLRLNGLTPPGGIPAAATALTGTAQFGFVSTTSC